MTDLNQTADIIDKWAEKLSYVFKTYGPDVANMALGVGRLAAIQGLVGGAVAIGFSAAAAKAVIWLYPKVAAEAGKDIMQQSIEKMAGGGLAMVVFSVASAGFACYGISQLTNVYYWAGLSNPAMLLAAKALGLM